MPTLIVVSRPVTLRAGATPPAAVVFDQRLLAAAQEVGWPTLACGMSEIPSDVSEPALYVTTDRAMIVAEALDLALLEPPFDLLACLSERFVRRKVEYATFGDLARLAGHTFVKPADPLDKWFDACVYSEALDIRTRGRKKPSAPILLSESVEWLVEYRYFVLEGQVVAGSPYIAYGRVVWSFNLKPELPTAGLPLVEAVCKELEGEVPPAFVIDVGQIEDRGWAVVEFNPVWSAGLLAADAQAVLPAFLRATRKRKELSAEDALGRAQRTGGMSYRPVEPC